MNVLFAARSNYKRVFIQLAENLFVILVRRSGTAGFIKKELICM
ncbi:hypothetical protein EDF67_103195 [Sphingobacterium sp. JUb78]|nr:hypothetical protein [Sphingobacterium kitahiroshimense]TCR11782.1 hypothetical protein EDF67_103195 [Sphingobacterium sp. JUb78]